MFKHAKTFRDHHFHNDLDTLKRQIKEIDNKKITDSNVVVEFARFNKCIEYIDVYFKIIDPDLLTEDSIRPLDEISVNVTNLSNNIEDYKLDYQPKHISNANNSVGYILQSLNNFRTIQPAVSKESIALILTTYGDTIDQSLSQINLPLVKKESGEIHLLKQQLIDGNDDQESIKLQIENLLEDFKNKHGELKQFYDEALNPDSEDTISNSIKTTHELLEKYKKNATDNIIELTNKIDEFNKFHITVFGEQDSETDKRTGGLKAELDDRVQEFDTFKESQEKKYLALTDQIEDLLPGATSTGLANAYNDERKKFKIPIRIWNGVFISSLSAMFLVTITDSVTYSSTNGWDWSFFNLTGAESGIMEHLNSLLLKLPFYLPLIWLAIYASTRRSDLQRLDQEYAHKEASAKSYSSYKDQIDELKEANDTLASKLLDSIIDSTSRNPSETLGKHSNDTPVGEVVKAIGEAVKTILDKINKQ